MAEVGTLGLDNAKSVFQVLGSRCCRRGCDPNSRLKVVEYFRVLQLRNGPGLKHDCFCSVKQPATTTDCVPRPKVCARQR